MENHITSITTTFSPASQNNSRKIIRDLLQKFVEKPSYGLSKVLEKYNIGVDWTYEHGESSSKPEGFHILDKSLWFPVSDEQLLEDLSL